MSHKAVLIRAPGQSDMRLIVPAAESDGDHIQEAVALVQGFLKIPVQRWIVEIHAVNDITDVQAKPAGNTNHHHPTHHHHQE